MNYRRFELELSIGRIQALHNNTRSGRRVLCLHGWLDNQASFLPLLPWLEGVECVAVDLIGHGRSDHRERGSFYHYIDYVRDIKLILDGLQWQACHLLGHSMGGSLSLMACSAFPEQVHSLCMIDSLHPMTREPADGPTMLKYAMQQITRWDAGREKVFASLEEAVKARLAASPFPQTADSARLIMQHATERSSEGYRLLSDARLNVRSPIMMCKAQLTPFLRGVRQPVLAVLGRDGLLNARKETLDAIQYFEDIELKILAGGHHLHMEHPREVAATYLDFLHRQV